MTMSCTFNSLHEIEFVEALDPQLFTTVAANQAAHACLIKELSNAQRAQQIARRATPKSLLFEARAECDKKIRRINHWIKAHPAI